MPNFSRSQLKTDINGGIHNKIGNVPNVDDAINRAVNEAWTDIDFRSVKRKAVLTPNLFSGVFEYSYPTDASGFQVSDLNRQKDNRPVSEEWQLVTEEEFHRDKDRKDNLVAVSIRDFNRRILISKRISDDTLTISPLDTLTSSGTWTAFGDAENLEADNLDFIQGSGSIKFDISSAGGTTAGITALDVNTFDVTDYLTGGSAFYNTKITDTTDITNYK